MIATRRKIAIAARPARHSNCVALRGPQSTKQGHSSQMTLEQQAKRKKCQSDDSLRGCHHAQRSETSMQSNATCDERRLVAKSVAPRAARTYQGGAVNLCEHPNICFRFADTERRYTRWPR